MANFGDIPSNVVLAAEQSIRRNAANDAFEAYTSGSGGTVYTFQNSLVEAAGVVNLVNDSASPGNSKYYGTNGSETRGFYDIPSSMVYPDAGIAFSTGAAWGTSIVGTNKTFPFFSAAGIENSGFYQGGFDDRSIINTVTLSELEFSNLGLIYTYGTGITFSIGSAYGTSLGFFTSRTNFLFAKDVRIENNMKFSVKENYDAHGYETLIAGGQVNTIIPGDYNGGDLRFLRGTGTGTGLPGNIYFGDAFTLLPVKVAETNVVYYDTTTGKISYGTVSTGTSVSFGLEHQIPYTNSTVDDFNYSSKFTWNDTTGVLTLNDTIQAPIERSLILKAGNADAGAAGYIYLTPGEHSSNMPLVYLGGTGFSKSSIMLTVAGSPAAISLHIRSKGAGALSIGDTPASTNIFGSTLAISSPTIQIGQPSYINVIMSGGAGSSTDVTGTSITLKGGSAWTTGNNNGGSIYLHGGAPNGSGVRGDVFFGDGSAGYLKAKTTETNVVHYNETTGLLSYGVGGTDFTYTNATAMPTAVGGFAEGTTFTAATLDQMWNGLLYPYQSPAFSAFTISGQTTTLEVGVDLTGGNRTFTWSTTNSSNINTNSIVIRDMNTSTDLATGLANDGTEVVDIGSAITKTTTGSTHVWRISAVNTNSVTFTRNYTVTWNSPYYDGVGAPGLSVAQIQALGKSLLAKGNQAIMFNPSSQVYYFAYPASYGLLTSIKDPNNFETIGDWTVHTVDFTNNPPNYNGGTISYYVYEFNNLTTQTNFIITFIY